jgi:hypothetical protein
VKVLLLLLALFSPVLIGFAVAPTNLGFLGAYFEIPGHVLAVVATASAVYFLLEESRISLVGRGKMSGYSSMISLGFWLGIEMVQELVPSHGAELTDALADVVGFVVAFGILLSWEVGPVSKGEGAIEAR